MSGLNPIIHVAAFLAALASCQPASAAEVSGTVSLDRRGLFAVNGAAVTGEHISLALVPGEAQPFKVRPAALTTIEIRGNRMHPPFLTVQRGDRIAFVNRDKVFHQLFSYSSSAPVSIQLGKANDANSTSQPYPLLETGTTHFFCRIHNKSYARIDVVDTPYIQNIKSGAPFLFENLEPGIWKLRLASPASETRWVEVRALTSPPPLHLTLSSRDGGKGHRHLAPSESAIEVLYTKD